VAKKCIELREEYVEQIPSLVAVACFLPGRAKDLSASARDKVAHNYYNTNYIINTHNHCKTAVNIHLPI